VVLALSGALGSGKTTFVQGLAEGLGLGSRIISPTFILMRSYNAKSVNLYHVDLYRLEGDIANDFENLGIADFWEKPNNIVVIEWAEKAKDLLPEKAIWINFENIDGDKRKIKLMDHYSLI